MTEVEWLVSDDWRPMLAFISSRWTQRKAILYVCAGLRALWELLFDEGSQYAVEEAECVAEGTATAGDVSYAEYCAEPIFDGLNDPCLFNAANIPYLALRIESGQLGERLLQYLNAQKEWPGGRLVREIVGNPFCPPSIAPSILAWNEGTIIRLAQTLYDERILPAGTLDNTRLLILADALEEAGCTDEQILMHLRSGGEHYRGCWVIDLLLGKQ